MTMRVWDFKHLTVAFDLESRGGCYKPEIHLHRRGRNGSPAGFGPKPWPWVLSVLFPPGWRRFNQNGRPRFARHLMLAIPLPHVRWATAYRLRRFGGLVAYRWVHLVWSRALRAPRPA
jgi:hypothetical protein